MTSAEASASADAIMLKAKAQLRGQSIHFKALDWSLRDLWRGRLSPAVASRAAAINEAMESATLASGASLSSATARLTSDLSVAKQPKD